MYRLACSFLILLFLFSYAAADDYDPALHQKAQDYQTYLEANHRPGLGAVLSVEYGEDERINPICYHYQGDSTIWTGMYLGSQAIRYIVTEDPGAEAQIIDTVRYLHDAMLITQTPGYLARFAGPNEFPFVCSDDKGPEKVLGYGDWNGYYWYDETSRDQYSGWWWGMVWAYDATDDEDTKQIIRDDVRAVMEMLEANQWHITDQNGEWTGNGAHWIGPMKRVAWAVMAAHILDEDHYWDLLDEVYEQNKTILWIDTWSFLNRYMEYYGNNLRHLDWQAIFKYWPDRERLTELWDIWMSANRPWVEFTYNPWFDSVHVTGCRRLGICDEDEMDAIADDYDLILGQYWDPPSYRRGITCSTMPLDPFSVFMDNLLTTYPALRDIINIRPITKDPRELTDRHWTDMYWQSGGVFEASCSTTENVRFVGPGWDYILAYYIGIYHGILPGPGPFDDGDFVDDLDDDDDMGDDDAADDDDDDDNDSGDDDDTASEDDDDVDSNDPADENTDDDTDDDGGCCG